MIIVDLYIIYIYINIISYHIISYHLISYHIISYHICIYIYIFHILGITIPLTNIFQRGGSTTTKINPRFPLKHPFFRHFSMLRRRTPGALPLRLALIEPTGHLNGGRGEIFTGVAGCFGGHCLDRLWASGLRFVAIFWDLLGCFWIVLA